MADWQCTAIWLQAKVRVWVLGLQPRLNPGRVCDAQRGQGGICGLRHHIREPLPSFTLLLGFMLSAFF